MRANGILSDANCVSRCICCASESAVEFVVRRKLLSPRLQFIYIPHLGDEKGDVLSLYKCENSVSVVVSKNFHHEEPIGKRKLLRDRLDRLLDRVRKQSKQSP